ncbi:MAG: hypothetical protein NVSMB2_04910 [Chloroflexota bacterium]
MKSLVPEYDYPTYVSTWDRVRRSGQDELTIDAWSAGRRYLSLACIVLSPDEETGLRELTEQFSRLIDTAVRAILEDRDWWSTLAWPWPAIELARQEPPHPHGRSSLYGRFDFLLDERGGWQLIEFNADTPSGGREATGLEPAILREVYPDFERVDRTSVGSRLVRALRARLDADQPARQHVGVISTHNWLEDIAQATWLGWHLRQSGLDACVGDVADLRVGTKSITLHGEPIDALYRFLPVERLYRRPLFARLCEAAIDRAVLPLNGLRAFLAQSKACLAWLWANRHSLPADDRTAIESHLPATLVARDRSAHDLLADGVVKHVNGREGDSVVFGRTLLERPDDWEARLLEGGYIVQRRVRSAPVKDLIVDDLARTVSVSADRVACVGAFAIGGRFGGVYTRLDGPITTSRATYAATLRQPRQRVVAPARQCE